MRAVLVALVACCSLGLATAYRPQLHKNVTEDGCPGRPSFSRMVLCYYEGRAAATELDPCLCSHLVLTNAARFPDESSKAPLTPFTLDAGLAAAAESLRKRNPELRVLGRVSGGARAALTTARGPELAAALAKMARSAGLDGLEVALDWEGARVGGGAHGKQRLVSLLKGLRSAMIVAASQGSRKRRSYAVYEEVEDDIPRPTWVSGLYIRPNGSVGATTTTTASPAENTHAKPVLRVKNEPLLLLQVSAKPGVLGKRFDLKPLSKYVDYFTVPTHNLTDGSESGVTYHHSRLMGLSDILNTDSVLDLLTGLGAPASRLIITLPAAGLRFQLQRQTRNEPRSPAVGPPTAISHQQVCSLLAEGGWTVERDEDLTAPYAFRNDSWIAFDDELSVEIKGKYALLRGLAGVGVWAIDDDDLGNMCGRGRSGLTRALSGTLASMARRTRSAVLQSLVEPLAAANSPFFVPVNAANSAGSLTISPYRVVRVVDRAGAVQVVRRDAQTEFECSRQGYFRHPQGCDRFYRCVKFDQRADDFSVFEYDCPSGLAFDERWEVCVWPGQARAPCDGSSEIRPVPRSKFTCSSPGYYADPENCRWFFACMDHRRDGSQLTPYEFRCPYGLGFDEQNLMCNWPWMVPNCGAAYSAAAYQSVTTGFGIEQGGFVQQKVVVPQVPLIPVLNPYNVQSNVYQQANVATNFGANVGPYAAVQKPIVAVPAYQAANQGYQYPATLPNFSPDLVNVQLQGNRDGLFSTSRPPIAAGQSYVSAGQVSQNNLNQAQQFNEAAVSVNTANQFNQNIAQIQNAGIRVQTPVQQNIAVTAQNNRAPVPQNIAVITQNNRAPVPQNIAVINQNNRAPVPQNIVVTAQNNRAPVPQNIAVINQNNRAPVPQNIAVTAQNNRAPVQQNIGVTAQNNRGVTQNTRVQTSSAAAAAVSQNSANQFQSSQFLSQNNAGAAVAFQALQAQFEEPSTTPVYSSLIFTTPSTTQNSIFESQSGVTQNINNFQSGGAVSSQAFANAGIRDDNLLSQFLTPNIGPVGIAAIQPQRTGVSYVNQNFNAITESSAAAISSSTSSSSSSSSAAVDAAYTLSDIIDDRNNAQQNQNNGLFGSRLPINNPPPLFAPQNIGLNPNRNIEFGSRLPQSVNTVATAQQQSQSSSSSSSLLNNFSSNRIRNQQNSVTILSPDTPSNADLGVINVADFSFQSSTIVPEQNLGQRRLDNNRNVVSSTPATGFSARPTVAGRPSVSDIVLTASPITDNYDESTSASPSTTAPSTTQEPSATFGTRGNNRNNDNVQSLLDTYSGRFGGLFDNDRDGFIQDVIATRNRGDNSRTNVNNEGTQFFDGNQRQNTPNFAANNPQQTRDQNNQAANINNNLRNQPINQESIYDSLGFTEVVNSRGQTQNPTFDQFQNSRTPQNQDQFVNNQGFNDDQSVNRNLNRNEGQTTTVQNNINQDQFDLIQTTLNPFPSSTNQAIQDQINIDFVNNGQFFAQPNQENSGDFGSTSSPVSGSLGSPQTEGQDQTTTRVYDEFDQQSVEPQNLGPIRNNGFEFANFDSQRQASQNIARTSTEKNFDTVRATPRVRPNSRQGFNQRYNQNLNTQQPIVVPNFSNFGDQGFGTPQNNFNVRLNQNNQFDSSRNTNNRGSVRFTSPGSDEQDVSSSIQTPQISQGRQRVTIVSRPTAANSLPLVEKLQGELGEGLGRKFDRYGPGGWRSANETLGPEACQREGLFRHPQDCNKFYECFYDSWKDKYTLHIFNCPIRLAYDPSISACNWPVDGPGCSGNRLLLHA